MKNTLLKTFTFAGLLSLVGSACLAGGSTPSDNETIQRVRQLDLGLSYQKVIPSSRLSFELEGTDRIVAQQASISFDGTLSKRRFENSYTGRLTRNGDVGNLTVRLPLRSTLFEEINLEGGRAIFRGSIKIELTNQVGVIARGSINGAHLTFQKSLEPSFGHFQVNEVYPNQTIEINGEGLLHPEEGETRAFVKSGKVKTPDGGERDISGETIPIRWRGDRQNGGFYIDPSIFGVQAADFHLNVVFENKLESKSAPIRGQQTFHLQGTLIPPTLSQISPSEASRGELVKLKGKGLMPNNEDEEYGMFLRFEGTFTPSTPDDPRAGKIPFEGTEPVEIAPTKVKNHTLARQRVWYEVTEDRKLRGLGATPGKFRGTITPIAIDEWGSQRGDAWEGSFEILPTKQIVYLKYLPAFTKGLEKYGLRNVEDAIRDRILDTVNRDYENYNVEFRAQKPEDFSDYATIEIGGPDPTGTRHFGYDNSFNDIAKDTENLYLNDYLGGVNEQSAEKFNAPYGGIFIKSFSFFSKQINPNNPHASKKFDQILSPFMPKLGGNPVRLHEWPDGPRKADIQKAVEMVAAVIGNTITHEIGHSLGMTYVPSDRVEPGAPFHNQNAGPYIMDAGSDRPFAERAELGAEPPRFNSRNREYLNSILPKQN